MQIKLSMFEGPLDLLLHLIEKSKIDILDVSLSEITKQYLAVVEEQLELDLAGDFLLMAATLIAIKSKTLLPSLKEEKEEEQFLQEEILTRLLEYKKYKKLGNLLEKKEEEQRKYFSRPPLKVVVEGKEVEGLSVDSLYKLFIQVVLASKENLTYTLEKDDFKIEECIENLYKEVVQNSPFSFFALFSPKSTSKSLLITMFLALLELLRLKKVVVIQNKNFDDIIVAKYERKEVIEVHY